MISKWLRKVHEPNSWIDYTSPSLSLLFPSLETMTIKIKETMHGWVRSVISLILFAMSYQDPKQGHWWMSFGDNTLIGYWPAELFTHLADHATMVEWGGEIVNTSPNGEHTSTQMGSGRFADPGFGQSSYFRNLEIVDSDNSLSSVESISTLAENSNCYNIKSSYSSEWGTFFYYGGPGNNPRCH